MYNWKFQVLLLSVKINLNSFFTRFGYRLGMVIHLTNLINQINRASGKESTHPECYMAL